MKVCTDACLFGAWIASLVQKKEIGFNEKDPVLDIGTGTGLLALMVAQNISSEIDALEIDADAASQAEENFNDSPWKERLNVINQDLLNFQLGKQYGLIISNPPFFGSALRSPDQQRNAAMHDSSLTLDQLIKAIPSLLSLDGSFAVLLPWHRSEEVEKMAEAAGLFIHQKMLVRQSPKHTFFRSMIVFGFKEKDAIIEEISIKDAEGKYTVQFEELLKGYYLKL